MEKEMTKPEMPIKSSKMSLNAVVKGKQARPFRVTLYSPEGAGKSTFGSQAPAPIFLGAEDGTAQLDVVRFAAPETWADVMEAVRVLTVEPHEYKTLVVDTLDWLEPLLWRAVCERAHVSAIEDIGGGYGKGYQAALDEWRVFLAALERMQKAQPINVLLLAHSWIRPFKDPESDGYDRYELKLHQKASGLVKEWSDAVLFANFEMYAKKDERTKRVRGISTGARMIYTSKTAAYDAKNRYGLPEVMPLAWADFAAALESSNTDKGALLDEINRKAVELGEAKKVSEAIERAAGDVTKLKQLNTWCNSQLSIKADAAGKQA